MALYFGSHQVRVALGSTACILHLVCAPPTTNITQLLSYDGFVLMDSNGRHLVPFVGDNRLLSNDNYMLKDLNNKYLLVKEV